MMRKTDINKYSSSNDDKTYLVKSAALNLSSVWKMVWKVLGTAFIVLAIAGTVVMISLLSFIYSLRNESIKLDLNKLKLNYTSFIYINDDNGNPMEYQRLSGGEDRIWADFSEIPLNMKNAMIAIEDKRFREHEGVDWYRTAGAVVTLFTKGSDYGGSTITQQLVKNLTGEGEVSLTRKVKEIFRALNLEKKYSKDEILETYLNVVNFGGGTQGVQAAANLYFDKDIKDCNLAECAAIAGITQNPSKYNPLLHPQANKTRQQTVLTAMYDQELITKAEYDVAMQQSEAMTFIGKTEENVIDNVPVWNWYIDAMFEDVVADLQESLSISEKEAVNMMYHGGLSIYCAMDEDAQVTAEEVFADEEILPTNPKIQAGYFMMDYNGRVLATVGRIGERSGNRLLSYATDTQRQPGSTIKPLSVYGPSIDEGIINYSTILQDEPLPDWFGKGRPGPSNAGRPYEGEVPVAYALAASLNAPAARLCEILTPMKSFDFLTQKLHFTHLNPKADSYSLSAMAIGGMNGGVTVREMVSGFQMFGNGGKYHEPYTYYYVLDHDGNVILDNRSNDSSQVISSESATIMHKLLRNVIYGRGGTAHRAQISGWEIYGKTGTTDENRDSWFIGGSPYAVAGIWTGYETPTAMSDNDSRNSLTLWKEVMVRYLEGKEPKSFEFDSNVISATYCEVTGKLASASCTETATGWYVRGNMPGRCDGVHPGSEESSALVEEPSSLPEENSSEPFDPNSSSSEGDWGQSSSRDPWFPDWPSSDPIGPSSSESSSEPVFPPPSSEPSSEPVSEPPPEPSSSEVSPEPPPDHWEDPFDGDPFD